MAEGAKVMVNAQRIVRQLKSRWILTAAAFIVAVLSASAFLSGEATSFLSGIVFGIHLVLILIIPVFPKISCTGIAAVYAVTSVVPFDFSFSQLWGVWLALVALGYFCSNTFSLAVTLLVIVSKFVDSLLSNGNHADLSEVIIFGTLFLLCWLCGVAVKSQEIIRKNRDTSHLLEQAQRKNAQLQANDALAVKLHDSVAGNLSYIVLATQEENPTIHDAALSTLNEIREIVGVLSKDGNTDPVKTSLTQLSLEEQTSQAIDFEENRMCILGFKGEVSTSLEYSHVNDANEKMIIQLIHEIYANIARHCNPQDSSYAVSIRIEKTQAILREINPLSNEQTLPNFHKSGMGLSLHKRAIFQAGGEMNYSAQMDTWVLFAKIPLSEPL
jgi:signal transduction histidine kinase